MKKAKKHWSQTKEWVAKEKEADDDYKKSRYKSFRTIGKLVAYLNGKKEIQ